MGALRNMPVTGVLVIAVITVLFILAVILLFYVRIRYRLLEGKARGNDLEVRGFRSAVLKEYTAAYKQYGQDVNTPAIIADVVGSRLSGLLLCERFLNNAVSLFVTLGLFGTFLGLSMSVSSLTELIGLSNTSEWLSVLDSVGGGLMSALSGMGVAFYTSLFGYMFSMVPAPISSSNLYESWCQLGSWHRSLVFQVKFPPLNFLARQSHSEATWKQVPCHPKVLPSALARCQTREKKPAWMTTF